MEINKLNEELESILNESALEDEIEKIIKENNLYFDIYSVDGDEIGVLVDGDWKHEHIYFDNLMSKHGFIKDHEEPYGENDGSDCFASIHYYTK